LTPTGFESWSVATVALGPNPSQELFRFVAFATSMLVLGLQEEERLSRDEFKLCYDSLYPEGQTWLPRGGATAPATTDGARPVPRKHPRQATTRPRARLSGRRRRRSMTQCGPLHPLRRELRGR
jgi:hypothetical protein